MEEILDKDEYLVDLSNIIYIPEIVYKLSSILECDEARSRRIHLKLGNVNLNQAQLLSIKSLINGVGSSLSSIETNSFITENTALSLGIIVTDILEENIVEINPSSTYKKADEIKDTKEQDNIEANICNDTIEDDVSQAQNDITEIAEEQEEQESIQEQDELQDVMDKLDVIFKTNENENILEIKEESETYIPRDKLDDIVVSEAEYTKEDLEIESFSTKYIKQTLRSGQVINYDGNLVIIGDCHSGTEIMASGDITVWGVLSGIAHAGLNGNTKARVRALQMNAVQLRIANCYSRRPDSLNTIYTEKTNSFIPEEARIVNGEIVVYKIND